MGAYFAAKEHIAFNKHPAIVEFLSMLGVKTGTNLFGNDASKDIQQFIASRLRSQLNDSVFKQKKKVGIFLIDIFIDI